MPPFLPFSLDEISFPWKYAIVYSQCKMITNTDIEKDKEMRKKKRDEKGSRMMRGGIKDLKRKRFPNNLQNLGILSAG
jgi:hypothetical protein